MQSLDKEARRVEVLKNFNTETSEFILANKFLDLVDEIKVMSKRLNIKTISVINSTRVLKNCIKANEIIKQFDDFDEISSQFDRILDIIYLNFLHKDELDDNDTKEILLLLINTFYDNLKVFIGLAFVTFIQKDITTFSKSLEGDIWQLEHQLLELKNISDNSSCEDSLDEWF
jgi:hypothetical protein